MANFPHHSKQHPTFETLETNSNLQAPHTVSYRSWICRGLLYKALLSSEHSLPFGPCPRECYLHEHHCHILEEISTSIYPLADFLSKSSDYTRLGLPIWHKPTINNSYSEEGLEDEIPWYHPARCNEYTLGSAAYPVPVHQ